MVRGEQRSIGFQPVFERASVPDRPLAKKDKQDAYATLRAPMRVTPKLSLFPSLLYPEAPGPSHGIGSMPMARFAEKVLSTMRDKFRGHVEFYPVN
jgi:hypothetical protein